MKRILSSLMLVLLLSLIAAAQETQAPVGANGTSAPSAAPRMVIGSMTHDFGEVKAGTPLRYSFKIRNDGKADLLIKDVAPS
jgi:hypothetical protein